ncbi:MAG: hypothetical protein GX624_12795 [Actinobacteria bacterium]|nr:hypothetical protein [Actinomycetota bacterium]
MKAIRTIVATAVIVFALTTAATAGVQRLADGVGAHQASGQTEAATAHSGSVTLSGEQFANLLNAVPDHRGDGRAQVARTAQKPAHGGDHARDHDHAQDRSRTHAGAHAVRGQSESAAGARVHHADETHGHAGTASRASTRTHDVAHHGGGQADRSTRHSGDGRHGGGHHGGEHD